MRVKIKELFPGNTKDKTTIINGTIFVSKDDKAVSGYATVFKRILNRFNDFGTLENIDYDFKSKLYKNLGNSDFDLGDAILKSGYHPDYFRRCFKNSPVFC